MQKSVSHAVQAACLSLLTSAVLAAAPLAAAELSEREQEGKAIAFDRSKGNCLACHLVDDGESPGNIGPPLVAMEARFPERKRLYNRIYDPTMFEPRTRMPPFGEHKILTETEINKVVDYLYTL